MGISHPFAAQVYATSFPALDAAVAEVGRYGEYLKPSRQSATALIDALEAKLGGSGDVADALDALRAAAGGLSSPCGSPRKPSADGAPSKTYTFDRKFLFKVLVLGNSQLAQLTGARGPNLQTNAACAGTTQAVGVAQDLLRAGRCDRVVVISGDDASGDALMPWVGNGFNALGAASAADEAKAALRATIVSPARSSARRTRRSTSASSARSSGCRCSTGRWWSRWRAAAAPSRTSSDCLRWTAGPKPSSTTVCAACPTRTRSHTHTRAPLSRAHRGHARVRRFFLCAHAQSVQLRLYYERDMNEKSTKKLRTRLWPAR